MTAYPQHKARTIGVAAAAAVVVVVAVDIVLTTLPRALHRLPVSCLLPRNAGVRRLLSVRAGRQLEKAACRVMFSGPEACAEAGGQLRAQL